MFNFRQLLDVWVEFRWTNATNNNRIEAPSKMCNRFLCRFIGEWCWRWVIFRNEIQYYKFNKALRFDLTFFFFFNYIASLSSMKVGDLHWQRRKTWPTTGNQIVQVNITHSQNEVITVSQVINWRYIKNKIAGKCTNFLSYGGYQMKRVWVRNIIGLKGRMRRIARKWPKILST